MRDVERKVPGKGGRWFGGWAAALLLTAMLPLTGCAGFFVCQKASCPTTTTTSGYSYLYATNSSVDSLHLAAYNISSGALTAVSGSPFALSFTPSAMVMARNNAYLYAAAPASGTSVTGAIYAYSVNTSTGVLTSANSGNALASTANTVESMAISQDGGWLYTVDTSGTLLSQFQVNTSTGALTASTTFALPGLVCSVAAPCMVRTAPSGGYVAVALGTAGTVVFPFSSSSGITSQSYAQLTTGSTAVGDYAVVFDKSNYLYVARSTGEAVYAVASGPTATLVSGSPFSAGTSPRAVALSIDSSTTAAGYTYNANYSGGTLYGFGIGSTGALTATTSSPYGAPANVTALLPDSSGKYLVAGGYSSGSGLNLYTINSDGSLSSSATAATGTTTTVPMLLAVTH